MRELDLIIEAFEQAHANETECVLATVVHVEGSSYRKAGARMLVDEYGQMTGAISGGCLEGDALRKALHALHKNENKLVTYDTSDENDAVIGAQLGCNGVIQVLFEPIDLERELNPIAILKQIASSKSKLVIASLFNLDKSKPQLGTQLVFDEQGLIIGSLEREQLIDKLKQDAALVFNQQHDHFGEYMIELEAQHAFLEFYNPPPTIVLVGAGNDAQILAQMADQLGWNVVVTDGRPTHANAQRFVSSCQIVVSKPEHVLENIQLSERTVFVLISHNYQYDLAVLKLLLPLSEIPYIGLLGPRKKFNRMLDDLRDEAIIPTEDQLARVFAPIGLNLGAETPAEIGLSILSEIQMVLSGGSGIALRDKQGPIHDKANMNFKVTTL